VSGDAGRGVVIAVLGAVSTTDVAQLRALHRSHAPMWGVLLDTASWVGPASATVGQTCAMLDLAGWRAVPAIKGAPFPSVWQALGAATQRSVRPA
jgi:hypothetical protein